MDFLKFLQKYWVAFVVPLMATVSTIIVFWQKIKPLFQSIKDKIAKHSKVNILHETIKKQNDELNSTLQNMQKQLIELKNETNERLTAQDKVLEQQNKQYEIDNIKTDGKVDALDSKLNMLIDIFKNKSSQ